MTPSTVTFDEFAEDYDRALNQGISISGETKDFFASRRIKWLSGLLDKRGFETRSVIDFGCGIGSATPYILRDLKAQSVLGIDPSAKSIRLAQANNSSVSVRFCRLDEYRPDAGVDLAFCNGVFHHIPVTERAASASYVYRSLREGGLFSFWENNPWNPGAMYCMKKKSLR